MKKLLFSAYSLDVGGIETALVNLINELKKNQYEITLVLEKKQGIFLKELDNKVNIIEYTPSENSSIIIRKVVNLFKRIKFIFKYKNKFDFATSYATYSLSGSFIARTASKNNAIWVHSEYMQYFRNNKNDYIDFFNSLNINKFKNIIFVSNNAKTIFIDEFKNLKKRCKVINNVINSEKIIKLSEENIQESKKNNTILYVGRLTEYDKRISRLIDVCKKLREDKIEFNVLIIGDGKDKRNYINKVKEYNLSDNIRFLGQKENPYPYFKISDILVLTSEYEGFPVVYNEARVLNLPILTTDVSDSKDVIDGKYGIVTKKDVESIYKNLKEMLVRKYIIKKRFDVEKYNTNNIEMIEKLINV